MVKEAQKLAGDTRTLAGLVDDVSGMRDYDLVSDIFGGKPMKVLVVFDALLSISFPNWDHSKFCCRFVKGTGQNMASRAITPNRTDHHK